MKKLVLSVLLLCASSAAFAGQATWTGQSHPAKNVDNEYGYACEYRALNGNTFWLWFQFTCQYTVEI